MWTERAEERGNYTFGGLSWLTPPRMFQFDEELFGALSLHDRDEDDMWLEEDDMEVECDATQVAVGMPIPSAPPLRDLTRYGVERNPGPKTPEPRKGPFGSKQSAKDKKKATAAERVKLSACVCPSEEADHTPQCAKMRVVRHAITRREWKIRDLNVRRDLQQAKREAEERPHLDGLLEEELKHEQLRARGVPEKLAIEMSLMRLNRETHELKVSELKLEIKQSKEAIRIADEKAENERTEKEAKELRKEEEDSAMMSLVLETLGDSPVTYWWIGPAGNVSWLIHLAVILFTVGAWNLPVWQAFGLLTVVWVTYGWLRMRTWGDHFSWTFNPGDATRMEIADLRPEGQSFGEIKYKRQRLVNAIFKVAPGFCSGTPASYETVLVSLELLSHIVGNQRMGTMAATQELVIQRIDQIATTMNGVIMNRYQPLVCENIGSNTSHLALGWWKDLNRRNAKLRGPDFAGAPRPTHVSWVA